MRPIQKISGRKLAEARQARFLTQRELGELVESSESNIRRIERREVAGIEPKRVPKFAAALKMTEGDFVKRIGVNGGSNGAGLKATPDANGHGPKADPDLSADLSDMMPGIRPGVFGEVRPAPVMNSLLASTTGDKPDTGPVRRTVPVPFDGRKVFVSPIQGSCMEPQWPDGAEVVFQLVEPGVDRIREGHGYYVQLDGSRNNESTFKRVFTDPARPGCYVLRCFNPMFAERQWVVKGSEIVGMAKALFRLDVPDQDGV